MLRVLLLAVSVVISGVTMADGSRNNADAGRGLSQAEAVQRALSKVNKRYQGRVLSARPIEGGARVRVKFLSKDGVVKILVVDPTED